MWGPIELLLSLFAATTTAVSGSAYMAQKAYHRANDDAIDAI
jgi:hypothetical protein